MKKYLMIVLVLAMLATTGVAFAEAVDAAPVMRVDLTRIIEAILALLASLITLKLIPWIKANTNEKQQRMLTAAVETAVYAAEQLYGAGNGKEKLMHVKNYLRNKGYDIDMDEIEAAVKALTIAQDSVV